EGPPRALLALTLSPPVGLRKLSATLVRALGLPEDTTPYDLAGHPGSLLDGLELAAGLAERDAGRPILVVVSDHQVATDERALDLLPAGGAAAVLVGAAGRVGRRGPRACGGPAGERVAGPRG